jgi:hypothetical protein
MTLPNTNRVIEHGIIEGLEAREIYPASEYCDPCEFTTIIGDRFRFQLGRTVSRTFTFQVKESDGRYTPHILVAPVFELVAFGPDRSAAIRMLRKIRPIGSSADEVAKQALEALME